MRLDIETLTGACFQNALATAISAPVDGLSIVDTSSIGIGSIPTGSASGRKTYKEHCNSTSCDYGNNCCFIVGVTSD